MIQPLKKTTATSKPSRLTQPTASSAVRSKASIRTDENASNVINVNRSSVSSNLVKPKAISVKPSLNKPLHDKIEQLTTELDASKTRYNDLENKFKSLESLINQKETKCVDLEALVEQKQSQADELSCRIASMTLDHDHTVDTLKRTISLLEWKLQDSGYDIVSLTKPASLDVTSEGVRLSEALLTRVCKLRERVDSQAHQSQSSHANTPHNTPRNDHEQSESITSIISEGPSIGTFDQCVSEAIHNPQFNLDSHHDINGVQNDNHIVAHLDTDEIIYEEENLVDQSFSENEIWASSF